MRRERSPSSNRLESEYSYQSPLDAFKNKESLEGLSGTVAGQIVYYKIGESTCEVQNMGKQSTKDSCSKIPSTRNSVIIINSDSDGETDGYNNNKTTNGQNENNGSLSVTDCSAKSTVLRRRKSRMSKERSMIESSIIPLDNDSSILCLSDLRKSLLDEENIVPSQTEDDVIELWSSLRNSSKAKKGKKNARHNGSETSIMFVIDKTPNFKNLDCLRTGVKRKRTDTAINTQNKKMKRNLRLNESIDDIDELFKPILEQHRLKCSNNVQRKKRKNNLALNNIKANAQSNNALKRKAKKTNSQENNKANSKAQLREIIVDGCNVAMAHTNGKEFSEKGIQIVVDYFKLRGHVVKVFLPQHVRRKQFTFLEELYKEGIVVFTPSRKIAGRQITSYDDRFILKYATSCGGIVISSDQYRDLYHEKPEWRNTILNRLLIPTFVGDYIMFPEDPLGKFGPNLDSFLRH